MEIKTKHFAPSDVAYVVRKHVAVPEGVDPSTNYPTIQDEMIARAPHTVIAMWMGP